MCVCVSRPMKFITLLRKNGETPKRVVDFLRERDTFRSKIKEIVEDFDEKSYNNNGETWKSSRILRVNPFFFIFSFFFSSFFFNFCFFFLIFFIFFIFFIFSFFFVFFHFFIFSFFSHFLSCSFFFFLFLFLLCFFLFCFSFIFCHLLSISIMFFLFLFLFLKKLFFLFVGGSKSVFFFWEAQISLRFLFTCLLIKFNFSARLEGVPLCALSSFFSSFFFSRFFSSFFLLFFSFFSFFFFFSFFLDLVLLPLLPFKIK